MVQIIGKILRSKINSSHAKQKLGYFNGYNLRKNYKKIAIN